MSDPELDKALGLAAVATIVLVILGAVAIVGGIVAAVIA